MKRYQKKLAAILIASLTAGSAVCFAQTYTSNTQTNVTVNYNQVQQNISNMVNPATLNGSGTDYEQGFVYATGTGIIDYGGAIGSEDLAREAAIIDAQRNLVGAVEGARIDSESTVEMKRLKSDTITRKMSGVVRYAVVVDEGLSKSGQSYYVKMVAPLYGVNSVAAAVFDDLPKIPDPLPQVTQPTIPQQEVTQVKSASYTGVVVDASGLGLEPCMSPVIYDTNGRAVYGIRNIDADFAVNHGMVGYAKSLPETQYNNSRVGAHALVVKAVAVKGGNNSANPVNVVISPEDADRILLANQSGGFLQRAAVMFVR